MSDKLTEQVTFRVTWKEKLGVEQEAESNGKTVSDFCRSRVLKHLGGNTLERRASKPKKKV
jgi:hypothetical protein